VDLYYGSNNNLNLAGNFDNRLTTPACFDWSTSGMTLVGLASRTFEAAGRDLGNSLDGFFYGPDTNFSLGELEVAAGRSVTLINEKYNTVGVGNLQDMNSCLEALYVHHLILRAGSTLTLNRARIYYEMLTQESGATIVQQGCAQAREVAPCSNADACGDGNVCTVDACNAGTCENVPIASLAYGDTAYTGEGSVVDVDDILCVLDAFAGIFSNCPVERADLTPCNIAACTTDDDCAALGAPCVQGRCHLLDVDDILAVLDAFVGLPGCPDPCP